MKSGARSLTLSAGLAMFSMFFGSGNLVFPLIVGQLSEGHFFVAFLGICLTGVVVPFLGVLALLLFNGDSGAFLGQLGRKAPFWFSLFALSLMGPFGVLARCITVAHGSFRLLVPDTPLWLFSLAACLVLFALTLKQHRIVAVLGNLLTPFLLISLGAIALCGLWTADFSSPNASGSWQGFQEGVLQGYQTMDLLAAFFFSSFIIRHLQNHPMTKDRPRASLRIFLHSSLIGIALLSAVYFALVTLGSTYTAQLATVPPQEMIGTVAKLALGPWAAPVVVAAVLLACLTTAIVLTSLFSDFLRKEIAQQKIPPAVSLLITLAIAYPISTLEFSGIAKILGPILDAVYPALIALTITSLLHKLWGWKATKGPFTIVLVLKLLARAL